jgi:aldose 1-epimerase
MPVSIGYHPYFMLTDAPRDAWTLSVAARTHWRLTETKVPSGETEPIGALFADAAHVPLQGSNLDDVFSDLVRDTEGRATMTLRGRTQQLDVVLGANYRAVVI